MEKTAYLTGEQRDELIKRFLGKQVEVIIDRPVGYIHRVKGITLHYTVNYGYLEGVMGGDGEALDVYVLGVTEPLERFTGRIIGAIRRADDIEDKLVAAPEGLLLHQAQILEAVHFVEQYFDSTADSLLRRSCGVIPYRMTDSGPQVLLLLQSNGCWTFPKGHMEPWETEEQTALRETWEETGLEPELLPGFREMVQYPTSRGSLKQVVLYLGRVQEEPRIDGREIREFRWESPEGAKKLLKREQQPVLERLVQRLSEEDTGWQEEKYGSLASMTAPFGTSGSWSC